MKTEEKAVELLSCPFCGGKAEIQRIGTSRQSSIIGCTDCHCTLEANESTEWTGSFWNTRAPASKWISVEDRLPENDDLVLCWSGGFVEGYFLRMGGAGNKWFDRCSNLDFLRVLTRSSHELARKLN